MFVQRYVGHLLAHPAPRLLCLLRDVAPLEQIPDSANTGISALVLVDLVVQMEILLKFLHVLCLFIPIFDVQEYVRDLPERVDRGSYTADRYYRVDVVALVVPHGDHRSKDDFDDEGVGVQVTGIQAVGVCVLSVDKVYLLFLLFDGVAPDVQRLNPQDAVFDDLGGILVHGAILIEVHIEAFVVRDISLCLSVSICREIGTSGVNSCSGGLNV